MRCMWVPITLALSCGARLPAGLSEDLPPWQRVLTGDDARNVEGLERRIEELLNSEMLAEALAAAQEVEAIRARVQGKDHWQAVDASWRVKALREVMGKPPRGQLDYQSVRAAIREVQALYGAGSYAKAQPHLEQALALTKELFGEEHPDTAACYNNLGTNMMYQGKYIEARTLYEKALAIRKKHLGEEHPDTATTFLNLASYLDARGNHTEAQPLFEKVLALRKRLKGEEHIDTAEAFSGLALNLGAQGRYADAEPLSVKALAIWTRLLGDEHLDTVRGYTNLAGNLYEQAKYAEAQPIFEKVLALSKKVLSEEHPNTAFAYDNLAKVLQAQGKYSEAQPLYEKELALTIKLLGEKHPDVANVYNNLAANLNSQGRHVEAQPLYEKALALWKERLGEEHPYTAVGYNNLAQNLLDQGRNAESQPLYERALALRKELLGEDHINTVMGRNNLAWSLEAQGKHEEAIEQWLIAAKGFEAARPRVSASGLGRADFSAEGSFLPAVSSALARAGRSSEAWLYWERGLARGLFDDLSARQARKITPADRERERRLAGEIDGLDARLAASPDPAAKTKPADLQPLRQKRLELQAELSAFEKHIVDTYGVAEGKTYEIEKVQASLPQDAALVGWLDVKRRAKTADLASTHWAVVVRSRGEPLWLKLPGSGEGESWTDEDEGLGGRLAAQLADRRRLPRPVDGGLLAKLERQRIEPVEKALRGSGSPPVRRLIVLPSPELRDVPVALLAERFTVSYAPSGSVLAWIREKKPAAPAQDAPSLLAIGDPAFKPQDVKNPDGDSPPPEHGAYLSTVLRGSNAEQSGLREGDVLLAYGGEPLQSPKDLAPAIGKTQVKDAIPVTLWRDGRQTEVKVSPGKLGVKLDERPPREAVRTEREVALVLRGLRGENGSYEPLPGTRCEVEAIAGKFPGRAEKLVGFAASESRIRELEASGKLSRYRYLHLATHGVPSRDRAFDSALILSQVGEPGLAAPGGQVVDGRLTAAEILRSWSLNAELVVLSACQTAVGHHAGGEGYLGFSQALLLSGARAVVLSLWKVDDTATALLMERFYANLLVARPGMDKRMEKAEALREAQRWLRELTAREVRDHAARLNALPSEAERGTVRPLRPPAPPTATPADGAADHPYADPYYWAAFILIGDPE